MYRGAEEFPRRVLLAVSGLSPQVVTETVYALAKKPAAGRAAYIPTEVHLLTTAEGGMRARLSLLRGGTGWFARLCEEYGLKGVEFNEEQIHVLKDGAGRPLEDIRGEEENRAAADGIAGWIRRFTSAGDSALHVSIAGGRKTMGFYAGYALSLYGRPQDRLSHVLVPAAFESHPEFFYPTKEPRVIYSAPPESRPLDTAAAEVTLAEIPFVRLRRWLPPEVLQRQASFDAVVEAASMTLSAARLSLDAGRCAAVCGGREVRLAPAEWAFLSWMARRKTQGLSGVACPSEGAPERALAEEYLKEYRLARGERRSGDRTPVALKRGMEKAFFLERKARLRKALADALGGDAGAYLPAAAGVRGETTWSLPLDGRAIDWQEAVEDRKGTR